MKCLHCEGIGNPLQCRRVTECSTSEVIHFFHDNDNGDDTYLFKKKDMFRNDNYSNKLKGIEVPNGNTCNKLGLHFLCHLIYREPKTHLDYPLKPGYRFSLKVFSKGLMQNLNLRTQLKLQ